MIAHPNPSLPIPRFLREHREGLFARWKSRMRERLPDAAALTEEQLIDCLPLFLDAVILGLEQNAGRLVDEKRSAASRSHGSQRYALAFPVGEVIQEYALLVVSAVELAEEIGISLAPRDISALSEVLFTGAADAANEHGLCEARGRQKEERQRIGFVAHELRNPLSSVRMAWDLLRHERDLGNTAF